jgi:hypothetical protein
MERRRFKAILGHQGFQAGGLAAIQEHIRNSVV